MINKYNRFFYKDKKLNGLSSCFGCKNKGIFNVGWSSMMWQSKINGRFYCDNCKEEFVKKHFNEYCLFVLKIIYVKQVDIGPYILNCDNYEEYLHESCHLNKRFILTKTEFKFLKRFFIYED